MVKTATIDLFAGCGGLTEGFEQSGLYDTLACVEWDPAPCENLRNRLKTRWAVSDADQRVIRFDIQRTEELIHGFNDPEYGFSSGLDELLAGRKPDLIIGGPPCQAYSIAGRIRDEYGMRFDYRNYLFESYLKVVKHYKPKAVIFENVPGILSACPGDTPIVQLIHRQFEDAGYALLPDLADAVIDFSKYGVPQRRKRVIILGLNMEIYKDQVWRLLNDFYQFILPSFEAENILTLRDAIGDLPGLYPAGTVSTVNGQKTAHTTVSGTVNNHIARYSNERDMQIFSLLARDIATGTNDYESVDARKELYTRFTGHISNIHKYNVLKWDEPSTTIPAHLCKDGLRHIHPDPEQARTITVREAARIQTFPDDYEFIGAMTLQFKMIGNAVPPEFARRLAVAINRLLSQEETKL